jgi:hypothetical protein
VDKAKAYQSNDSCLEAAAAAYVTIRETCVDSSKLKIEANDIKFSPRAQIVSTHMQPNKAERQK